MRLTLTETKLRNIITESIRNVLMEAKGIKSKKAYDIIKQHGGFSRDDVGHKVYDIHNLKDEDIIAVITYTELLDIYNQGRKIDHGRWVENFGLKQWAMKNGCELRPQDDVEAIELGDGSYMIIQVINARFDRVSDTGKEGFYQQHQKLSQRENNRYNDGKRDYVWNNSQAHSTFRNPWFKEWDKESRKREMEQIRNRYKEMREKNQQQ